jgi:hypothetical protein
MNYLNSNLAREVGRVVRWREKFWGRRYQAIPVSSEEAAQVDRLRYLLRHGCKEGLVRKPEDWPGATSLLAMVSGTTVAGCWFDRTAEHRAAKRRRSLDPSPFVNNELLQLTPLPCWRHLSAETYAARVCELVGQIEKETERWILESGRVPLGRERLLRQHPNLQPRRIEKRPAPLVHAASRAVRLAFRRGFREFVVAFRHASATLRLGRDPTRALLLFPLGSFPARPAFVTTGARL